MDGSKGNGGGSQRSGPVRLDSVNFTAADDRVVKLAGESAGNALIVSVLDTLREEKQVKQYLELIRRYDKNHNPGPYHALGFSSAQVMVEGLERAGSDLTRENLVEALETFDNWDENVFSIPISYGPNLRGGMATRLFFTRADLEKEKLVRVTEDILFEMP